MNKKEIGGIEKYSYNLYENMKKNGIDVILFDFNFSEKNQNDLLNLIFFDLILPLKFLFKQKKIDIVHSTSHTHTFFFPFYRIRKITTIHDTITFKLKPPKKILQKLRFLYGRLLYKISMKSSDIIIVDSTQTFNELKSLFPKFKNKIKVVNIGCEYNFNRKFRSIELKRKIILGYQGSIQRRKNVFAVVEIFNHLLSKGDFGGKDIELWICGGIIKSEKKYFYSIMKYIINNNISDKVKIKGFIKESSLRDNYNKFDFFIFPSIYEGFGLPIIEAAKLGIPVILFKNSKIAKEIKSIGYECESAKEAAIAISKMIKNSSEYKTASLKSLEKSKRFTWDNCVKNTIKLYKKLTGE